MLELIVEDLQTLISEQPKKSGISSRNVTKTGDSYNPF